MIDHLDKQTLNLPLDQKRGRGRPATGKALSNAERQRLYRERQKAQRNENSGSEENQALDRLAIEHTEFVKRKQREVDQLKAQIRELETQLAQRNDKKKPEKGLTYRKLTEYTLDQLKDNEKRAKPEMAREWSFGAYMLWQSLAVTMNVQKAALEADMAKMRPMAGLETKAPK